MMPKGIRLTNDEAPLNSLQIDDHFNSINNLSGKIEADSLNAKLYFARAIDFMLVQDFQSSAQDLSKAINLDPNFTLAYFCQAVVYSKQLELKDYSLDYEAVESKAGVIGKGGVMNPNDQISATQAVFADPTKMEYELILRNYNKVVELNPEFAYTYFNRGNIKYSQNDFRSAILDYNEAIKQNPSFYEAYYNRGLARFQIKDKERALDDMRKAGEGGIVAAYGIIKRMTE